MNGKVVIVTGAGAGIGRRIAEVASARGAVVALLDRNAGPAGEAAAAIEERGGKVLALVADVTSRADVRDAVKRVLNRWDRVDVRINNAGIVRVGSVTETSEEDWDLVLAVNLKGAFLCSAEVLPVMTGNGSGSIMNISSVAGIGGSPGLAAYSASKAGLINLTRQMAKDYGPVGVGVNCVCPGTIPTDMHRALYAEEEAEETLAQWAMNKPLRRNGTTDDIAEAVAYLAFDAARFVTGVILPVDGGSSI